MNYVFLTGEIATSPESLSEPETAFFCIVTQDFTLPCQVPQEDYHTILCSGTFAALALKVLAPGDRITVVGTLRCKTRNRGLAVVHADNLELIRVRSLSPTDNDGPPVFPRPTAPRREGGLRR